MALFVSFLALLAALMSPAAHASSAMQANMAHTDGNPFLTGCGQVPLRTRVFNPPEIYSVNGVLTVRLVLAGSSDPLQSTLCYLWTYPSKNGPVTLSDPPTLHVKQGEKIILQLVNTLFPPPITGQAPPVNSQMPPAFDVERSGDLGMNSMNMDMGADGTKLPCGQPFVPPAPPTPDPKTGRIYGYHRAPWNESNLHFHGLNVSPKSPADDVVDILLCPTQKGGNPTVFTYELDLPKNEPPGTYWYHPHAHGESDHQLLSGLTGVIIVDTINKSIPDTLPNRIIVIRDQGKSGAAHPRWGQGPSPARVSWAEQQFQQQVGHDWYGRPGGYPFQDPDQCPTSAGPPPAYNTKALSVNHVPLPPLPTGTQGLPETTIAAGETDYYRFANTSSDTILDVTATLNGNPMNMMVTSRDSVPLIVANGQPTWQAVPFDHIFVPPASRFEYYLTGTNPGDQIVFTTLTIDTGCWGDTTLQRNLFVVNVTASNGKQIVRIPKPVANPTKQRFSDLYNAKPVRHRYVAFTEYNAQGDFYITEISNPKAVEHPFVMGGPADIVVKAGTVEDWTILDYTQETHMFHIHQIHFLVLKAKDYEFGLGQLLDTINVPYGVFKKPGETSGNDMIPGAVTLRMDFRDKDIIGEFVYHCHILAHEDGGMMAKIRIVP